jgi:hypothetical protein
MGVFKWAQRDLIEYSIGTLLGILTSIYKETLKVDSYLVYYRQSYIMKVLFLFFIIGVTSFQAVYAFQPSEQSDFPGNMTTGENGSSAPAYMIGHPNNSNCDTNSYPSTACDIVQDLISLPADKVREYPLSDQPGSVIVLTLTLLDSGNLTKVLQNSLPKDLSIIRDKITSEEFYTALSRIPEPEREQIVNRSLS